MNKSGNNFWKYLLKPFRSTKDGNHELEFDKIAAQEPKQFSFETLVAATKDFHPDHKLGEGGFGPVFKGKLEDGREIAVKQLSQSLSQGKEEFTTKAKLLARVQHRNVVTLLGYCAHGPEKLLVYEYAANESLDKHLFKSGRGDALDWKRRYDIITGVARGLLYLHEISAVAIVHRDIKAGNILLDDKWVPKIADFGMARLFPVDERHVNTREAVTNGYMAPEYVMHGRLSPKADVYSFGVVVLELISGQKYSNFIASLDAENLLERVKDNPLVVQAYDLFKKGKSLEVMDPRLASSAVPDQVAMCIQIGLLCTQSDPQYRPTMDRVVLLLSKKPRTLEEPRRPGYPGSRYRRPRRPTASTGSGELNSKTFGSFVNSDGHSATVTTSTSHLTSSQSSPHGKHPMQGNNTSTMRRVTNELSHVGKVAVQPDKQNLYVPDRKSEEEEDWEHLQLQLHPMHQYSDCGSTSGTAPEGGVLPKEELVQNLFPKDEESSTKLTEDLSGTNMYTLPHYIFGLVALQKLILRSCAILMMELPPEIGELTNLEVLDLEGTEILRLPKEIAKLVKLMCLKVSFYGYANQTVIPRRVLSNLSRLKELIIDVKPYGEWWDVEVEAIIDDLRNLKELTTLKLYLPTPELLKYITSIFPGLANFRFTVGRQEEHFISRLPRNVEEEFNNREKLEKGLKFINGDCIPNEITKVLKHADAFFLQRHWTTESLSEFGHENLNEVKFFLVMECNEFRTIVDSEKLYQGKDGSAESEDFPGFDKAMALGSVERLIIRYMKNMESIWKGPVGKRSLSNLKSLALHTCPNLATLFTIDMLINLMNLEELTVEDCPKINSLVSFKDSGSELVPFLPSLKKISLLWLPGLASISNGLEIALKLERMVIYYCPKLEKLSTAEVSSKELKVIKGEKEWWDALKWYESDVSTELEDYLARLFIPLRRDGDLMAQLTEDEIAASGQGKVGSFKRLDCLSNFSKEELLEEISSEELEEISSEELEEISSEEVGGFKILVASDASSGGSEKKRGSIRGVYATSNKSTPAREPGSVKFTLEEILRATENFSPTFKIGQGGFGTVYKGRLQDGTIVAIKRAKKSAYDKHVGQEFQNEIRTLAQIEHLSLVKYYGYLEHEDERVIVLEYVSNGTLRDHLDCMRGNILDLASRLDIAVDVAHAVTTLHMHTDHPIIHRDIKSSNILITENLRAKVADFGFARLAADSDATHVSTQVRETRGYLDPEYLRTYQLTEKSDVYSFGVLLVELVTGRRPIEPKQELKEQRLTTRWAIKKFTDGDAISVLDPRLERSPANNLALEKTLKLALKCLAPYGQNRPTMRRCAEILWCIRKDYRVLSASGTVTPFSFL